jgi:hypothetical protein
MPDDAESSLRRHGWLVATEEGGGFTWATLVSAENPDFVVARYGRGEDADGAIARAWERYQVEQIGRPSSP